MIGTAAIGAISSASLLVDSVALAAATAFSNHARAAVSDVQSSSALAYAWKSVSKPSGRNSPSMNQSIV